MAVMAVMAVMAAPTAVTATAIDSSKKNNRSSSCIKGSDNSNDTDREANCNNKR